MTRTNIDLDDALVDKAMRLFHLDSKRAVVQLALERLVGSRGMPIDEQLAMEGTGWDGDLASLRDDADAR